MLSGTILYKPYIRVISLRPLYETTFKKIPIGYLWLKVAVNITILNINKLYDILVTLSLPFVGNGFNCVKLHELTCMYIVVGQGIGRAKY